MRDGFSDEHLLIEGFEGVMAAPIDGLAGLESHLVGEEIERLGFLGRSARRASFIAGRVLAKRAVLRLVDPEGVRGLVSRDIEIRRDETGRPVVRFCREWQLPVAVSVSHGGAYAVAGAVREGRIGVDVEPLSDKAYRLRDRIATDRENEIVAAASDTLAQHQANITGLFSAKEAMAKCLGTHLFQALNDYRLSHLDNETIVLRDEGNHAIYRVQKTIRDHHVITVLRSGSEP